MSKGGFLLRLALREGRRQRGELILFMSSIVLGIAALVAINSFNDNLVRDIDKQTAALLGADLEISSNRTISDSVRALIDDVPGPKAEQWDLLTMAYFPSQDKGQFVRLKASTSGFPFYGEIKTDPPKSLQAIRSGLGALVDQGLLKSLEVEIGDTVRLGEIDFIVEASMVSSEGSSAFTSTFAPGIQIDLEQLKATGLVRSGSLVNYAIYKKASSEVVDSWIDQNREYLRTTNVRTETVAERKEEMGEAFDYLNQFLNLVALVALVLGCIGMASSVFIYIKRKEKTIAIFRCLGLSGQEAGTVFFFQIFIWGVVSVLFGAALGAGIQMLIPELFREILPYQVEFQLSWGAISEGILVGIVLTALFCLLPLSGIGKVSALKALRPSFSAKNSEGLSRRQILLWAGITAALYGYLAFITKDFISALMFTGALGVTFAILYFSSKLFTWVVRKSIPRKINFVWRQGLANLFRPQNRTALLVMSIGMGVSILGVLIIIQGLLLHNVEQMGEGNQPNVVLYGIESDQLTGLEEMTVELDMPVIQSVPVVTVQLEAWKGRTKAEWLADTTRDTERWAMRRETRVSYRDSLESNEELIEGVFPKASQDSIYVSLGDGYAEALKVGLGDELIFNVQGVRMTTYVGSIRKIDMANLQARFFILFPSGVLEAAPQFHVLVSKTSGEVSTAEYRNRVAAAFPNVSVIDLTSILAAVQDILNKVTYVIKFMAGFSIFTGFIVLFSALLLSKFQRMKDGVLLRTLGASRARVLKINAVEYAMIGFFAGLVGIVVSLTFAYLISTFRLGLEFSVSTTTLLGMWGAVIASTTLIGVITTLDVVKETPLKVLRRV